MRHSFETPALVLAGGYGLTALGVIRTLARARISSFVLGGESSHARHSRWYRPPPGSSVGPEGECDLACWLDESPLERAVLIPCTDIWAAQIARLEPELAARFPASLASADVLETFLDKGRFGELLRDTGVPHPRTEPVAEPAGLAALPDSAFADAFLKPRDSQRFFQRYGTKAFRVAGRADAEERLREIGAAGLATILQEYIPGPAHHHVFVDGFLDRDGRLCATFARRRLRMYPPDFGNSSYMVSVPQEEVAGAIATVRRLMEQVRYRGIFSAEFKYDARDGLFKILEVNARPWWYVEFTARCGVDVCTMAYRDALALQVEPTEPYRVGRTCVFPYYDLSACRELRRSGRLSLGAWARSWLTAEQPVFRWSDPLPAVIETLKGLVRLLRRVIFSPS
jgi:D-aspartate ligase